MKLIKKTIVKIVYFCGYDLIKHEDNTQNQVLDTSKVTFVNKKALRSKKINYGCGPKLMKNWLNVDLCINDKRGFLTANVDLRGKHPFLDNQFQYGFAEDFIEHLSQSDQILFLQEVFRTFKRGGVLRLSFPGLEGILKEHYKQGYYDDILWARQQAYLQWRHINYPNRKEIVLICKQIGFKSVRFVKYGKSTFKELKDLETRYLQKSVNTYVEIIK